VDNKPQPMAGFTVGTVSPYKRAPQVKRKSTYQLFKHSSESESDHKHVKFDYVGETPPPPLTRRLTPMSDLLESLLEVEKEDITQETSVEERSHLPSSIEESFPPPPLIRRLTPLSALLESSLANTPTKDKEDLVYFPVDLDVDKLQDWKEILKTEQNNNNLDKKDNRPGGALVKVNNTDIAVFKYGDSVLATSEKCPHAGGPLHLGDIEVLPDKSLCVRCPWHKWAFCILSPSSKTDYTTSRTDLTKVGSCVHPPSRTDKKLEVFPAIIGNNRRHIKIGFESIAKATLMDENF